MTLGERLSEYRANAKLSQDALAEKIGVTRQTISKWETDQSTPEFNKIIPLCEIFGITTDELIKGEKEETKTVTKSSEKEESLYNEKRNKQKAKVISFSVFLYCIGTFSLPYMIEGLKYEETHAVMITTTLWSIATIMLVYFFISHPKKKAERKRSIEQEIDNSEAKKEVNKIEKGIIEVVALIFLVVYLVVSFMTMAWNITWILWIIFAVVRAIIKLVFEIRRESHAK